MVHPKDLGMQGQWRPVTPLKPIPMKRPQALSSPNWLESLDVNGSNNGQMGALEFDDDGLAQMPYRSLLAINDPAIVSKMNLASLMAAQGGGGGGVGSQRWNAQISNRNPLLVNGRMVLPSNRGDAFNQYLPLNRGDVCNQFLPLNRGDVNNQSLQFNRGDVNNQSPQFNRGDVNNQSLLMNHEGVNTRFVPMTREDISKQVLPTQWEDVSSQFMQSSHAHANGRILPPVPSKPQFPFLPKLNSLPENNMASTFVSDAMVYPATPATMEKHQGERIHNHLPPEIIDLDCDEISTNHSSNLPQYMADTQVEPCFSNRVEPSQIIPSQYQDCERNVTVNLSQELGAQQNVVLNSSKALGVQQAEGEHQDIDLNNTPQQKPKRKKHRPKVIREGKPVRTPKATTPKPPKASGNPSVKRKYVRRNVKDVNPQEKPSTTLEEALKEAVGPNSQSRSKLVRRSLNFDLEDCQARVDQLSGSESMTFSQNVYEAQGRHAYAAPETVVISHTTPGVHSSQGRGLVVFENSMGGGIGFDLNSSTDQFADERVRIPQTPNQPPQPSRQEMLKAKWREDFARMMSSMAPTVQHARREGGELQRVERMINCQNVQHNSDRHLKDGHHSRNVPLQGTKRDYNLLGDAQVESNGSSMRVNNGVHCANDNYNDIQKRRRIENAFTSACTPNGRKLVPSMQNTNKTLTLQDAKKTFTFADAQKLMAREKRQSQNCMLLLNQVARTLSQVQAQSQIPRDNVADINKVSTPRQDCNQPFTPQKSPVCSNGYEKDEICGPKARVEVLITNQTKSKTGRPKKKEDHVNSMATNVNHLKHIATTCKIGSSPITESEAQRSHQNYKASGVLISYGDPIEALVRKLRHLNINGHYGHDGVASQPQNALVPYVGGGGTMVPFEGPFELLKKRKPRPKVDLDPESNRVWKLLMGKETEREEGTDADKEKWWEEERRVFRGRVDSFIARMHLIQGDRRFSRWKGSVVDSIIGVFLTQNVSDHLSSSAFMSLASRFPPKSNGNNKNANAETIRSPIIISEPESCDQSSLEINETKEMDKINESLESNIDFSKESSLDFHEIGQKSPDSVLGTTVTVASCASAVESEDRRSLEDVVSSQNSVDSSQNSSECPGQTTLLNFEADELLPGGICCGFNSFTELLQMANDRVLQDPKVTDNGGVVSAEYGDGIDWSLLCASDTHLNLSSAPQSCSHSNFLNSIFMGMENGGAVITEKNRSYLPTPAFELNETSINVSSTTAMGRNKPLIAEIAPHFNSCRPVSKYTSLQNENYACCQSETSLKENVSSVCLNQQDENTAMFQQRERVSEVQMQRTHKPVATSHTCSFTQNGNQRNNLVSTDVAESILQNEVHASQKVSDETSNNASMGKKVKAETDKKMTFDWDSLRKEACRCSGKKERNSDAMDSLDYDAVRQANVNEISHAIRERGMNNMLAERIKDFLNRLVKDHGSTDLEWLRDVPPDKAKDYLLSIRGLGLKSVECVRLLTLHHLAFPVDTNVGRICVRLGWVPLQPLPESLQLHLLEMYPILETIQKYLWPRLCKLDQRTLYELHYQLITFGKVFCTKSKPNCNSCPMRGECKHFASAYASARLALPGPGEKQIVSSSVPLSSESARGQVPNPLPLPPLEGHAFSQEQTVPRNYEPIIEEPATPEPECIETSVIDIEDAFYDDPDEIPTIKLNFEEFTHNLQNYMQANNLGLQDGDMSKALVAVTPEAAAIPTPMLKNVNRLRTEHLVYELPDSHHLLKGLDKREPDDPCPYLLAIWTPGETAQSSEAPKSCCDSQDSGKLCDKNTCFSCNSIREAQAQMVRGTILIPCRTANRGSFPLNGTYFQVNEVFADHESSRNPVNVPRDWIWNLPRRTVYFGTSIPSIFKGLTTEGIQHCFWRGFVCVRGFDRTVRAPKPLFARLHFPASKVTRNKRTTAATAAAGGGREEA